MSNLQRDLQKRRLYSRLLGLALIGLVLIALEAMPASAQTPWSTPDPTTGNINNTNSGNVGIGTTDPLYKTHIRGANASPSLTAASGIFAIDAGPSTNNQLTIGSYAASPFGFWLQAKDNQNGGGSNNKYPISLNPLGGNVGIGTATPNARLTVSGNTGMPPPAPPGVVAYFANENDGNTFMTADAYGSYAGGNYHSDFLFRSARGTMASPSASQANDIIGQIQARGYGATGFASTSRSSIRLIASENWTDSAQGAYLSFLTTPNTTTAMAEAVRITDAGNVGIGTTTPSELLHLSKNQDNNTMVLVENSSGGSSAQANFRARNDVGMLGQMGVYSSAHGAYGAIGANDAYQYSNSNLVLMADGSGKVIKFTTGGSSEKMRIDAGGNVGINNTSPAEKLDVVGNIKVTGNISVSGNINAKYQDVAEWVPASEQIPAGTVVVLDSTKSNHVIASTTGYDTRVAGVVSAQPGIALGESGDNKVLVATTGRVRIKVDATRSPIQVGDLLVTSDIPGLAMKSVPVNLGGVQFHRPGTLIGKALEPLAKGQGTILVLLSLQ